MTENRVFWGEIHDNVCQFDDCPVTPEQNVALARTHLDFYAPAYYVSETVLVEAVDGRPGTIRLEGWKSPEKLARQWAQVQDATRAAHEPGAFVTFPGYEWQGDGGSGDHNVIFREEGGTIARVATLSELYAALQGQAVIAIPHHTGYQPGHRGRDWGVHDERLSPFTEIYSVHGSSEADDEWLGLRTNAKMGPGVAGGTYQDALERGLHLGAVCSTDGTGRFPGIYGWGLMACLARELTREALWAAFAERRVYGVTGDRIVLDCRVNGAPMGACITARGGRELQVAVAGLDALDRVEVLRGSRVIHTHAHQGTWDVPPAGQRSRFRLRVEVGWGPFASEVGPRPPREWRGTLTLSGGARILDWSPCWLTGGQEAPVLEGSVAHFRLCAPQAGPGDATLRRSQNSDVFTVEARPEDRVDLQIGGLSMGAPVGELCRGSRVLWDQPEAERLLREHFGLAVEELERPGLPRLLAHKAKVHRAIPEAGYATSFSLVDDEPLAGETYYRVRVEQRNGQRAWSSPIWVRPER